MSDLDHDSRATAVGRSRELNKTGEYPTFASAASRTGGGEGSGGRHSNNREMTSRRSSLESGEISSAGGSRTPTLDVKYGRMKRRRLSESSIGSAFGEDPKPPKAVSVAESSDVEDIASEPHAMENNTTLPETRICDLSHQEVVQQELYFDLDLDKYPDDLCYCLCCGGRGHTESKCSKATCEHCGAKEIHASYACPTYRKCRLCRQRGHDTSECTNPASVSNSDPCDVCQVVGHVEEECPRLWSTSLQSDPTYKIRKIPDRKMTRACYSCGSNEHWGDDCQYRDRAMPPSLVKTWSKAFADRFVIEHDSRVESVEHRNKLVEEEQQVKSAPAW